MTVRSMKLFTPLGFSTFDAIVLDDNLGVIYLENGKRVGAADRRVIPGQYPPGFVVVLFAGVIVSRPFASLYEALCYGNSIRDLVDWPNWQRDPQDVHARLLDWAQRWAEAGGWLGTTESVGISA